MGSSKEYIALPTSDNQTPDSPPPYEVNKSPWLRRHWKVTALLATFTTLLIIGFFIHPSCHEKRHIKYVDLGFSHDSQHENSAKHDLTRLMAELVDKVENDHFDSKPHHHRHHEKHRPHHEHHHDHQPELEEQHHNKNYHHHHHQPEHEEQHHNKNHHHHHHHHQPEHDGPDQNKNHHHPPRPEHRQSDRGNHSPSGEHHHSDHHKHPHHQEHSEHHGHTHHNHHDHHRHHQNKKRQNEEEVYVQKLPTHNRFKIPGLQRRDEQQQQQQQQPWKQSYHVSPSANTSLHIKTARLHESLQGSVVLRQDTTGMEQDIIVTFYTDENSGCDKSAPTRLVADTHGHAFFLRAHSSPFATPGSTRDYSIDIVLPSSMKSMKHLEIEINNGTISIDNSLQLAFGYVKLTTAHGVISVEHLTSDRIILGTYSGVISGTFQPTEQFAVGAYYGLSNVRLLQAPSTKTVHCHAQQGLHIASSSPHGISTLSLEHNAFKGRFEAQGLENVPNVNFTSNNQDTYEYQLLDTHVSGWFLNDTNVDQLIIHGRDDINLTFE